MLFSRIAVAFFLLSACDAPPQSAPSASSQENKSSLAADTSEFKQRQIAFLNRIRTADPSQRTIDRAFLNEQNELGLILDRTVEMEKIPALMRTMLTQMAGEFPRQDLIVIAYTPSEPPRKIGTARLDARTGEMNYIPEN